MQKLLLVGTIFSLAILFYWFSLRPINIRQQCFADKLQAIQKRHDDNLNYYFVGGGLPNLDKDIDADRNKPMYVKDLNARLDEYWGDVAYKNCLSKKGLDL